MRFAKSWLASAVPEKAKASASATTLGLLTIELPPKRTSEKKRCWYDASIIFNHQGLKIVNHEVLKAASWATLGVCTIAEIFFWTQEKVALFHSQICR